MKHFLLFLVIIGMWNIWVGCSDKENSAGDTDSNGTGTDGDTDADSDTDTDSDGDTDALIPGGEAGAVGVQDMALEEPPVTAVFIDPANGADTAQDGTVEHPFDSFDDVSVSGDTIYAVKRGATLSMGGVNLKSGVQIMSYGDSGGERPILQSTMDASDGTNKHVFASGWGGISGVVIRDVVIECPTATSCIRFGGGDLNNSNIKIINVKTKGGAWGIRAFGIDGFTVLNTEVSHAKDDGIFVNGNENIEIGNCYVHDVNLNWQPPVTPESDAAGDGIQFDGCNHWHVHHTVMDRTNSGNKFCFISNNAEQTDGVLEYNHMSGPLPVSGGAGVYFHNGDGLIVRYNTIVGPVSSAVYTHATNVQFYGNIVRDVESGFYGSASANVYNNSFYNVGDGVQGGEISVRNNIFVMKDGASPFGGVSVLTESNNLVVNAEGTANSMVGNAGYVDADNGDFHLDASSDAIDAGTDIGLGVDIFGTSIPQGAAPDIGAVEQIQ